MPHPDAFWERGLIKITTESFGDGYLKKLRKRLPKDYLHRKLAQQLSEKMIVLQAYKRRLLAG